MAKKVKTKKEPKKKVYNPLTFAKGILRRYSRTWIPMYEARKLAKRGPNKYECAACKELFGTKEIQIDHRIPVVDIELGDQGLEIFAQRLYCEVENLDVLCKNCHAAKSSTEMHLRKLARQRKKDEEK